MFSPISNTDRVLEENHCNCNGAADRQSQGGALQSIRGCALGFAHVRLVTCCLAPNSRARSSADYCTVRRAPRASASLWGCDDELRCERRPSPLLRHYSRAALSSELHLSAPTPQAMALTMMAGLFTRAIVFGASRPAAGSALVGSRLSARLASPRMISVLVP